uniref:Thaumatin-like protein n=1 Tax=Lotus japonicus TaxID=34305 RepID=I3RZK9_LOTJA|nr:unknown [Lotus japonicus]
MQLPMSIAVFFVILPSILYGINVEAHQVTFYIHNKCPFPIWPATSPNSGQPVIAEGGFYLASGQTQRVVAPWTWSGRIWARTGCNFASNWKPACETGDCDGRLACNGLIGTPPVTLVEFSLQGGRGKPNFYDVSIVDGYNIPVSVTPKITNPKCTIQGCLKDLKRCCLHELEVLNAKGEVVACKSACLAFDNDKFCCRNEYGSPEKCKPSVYSKIFKDACPSYFSYAFDTPSPLVSCGSSEYIITFCPSGWGDAGEHKSQ